MIQISLNHSWSFKVAPTNYADLEPPFSEVATALTDAGPAQPDECAKEPAQAAGLQPDPLEASHLEGKWILNFKLLTSSDSASHHPLRHQGRVDQLRRAISKLRLRRVEHRIVGHRTYPRSTTWSSLRNDRLISASWYPILCRGLKGCSQTSSCFSLRPPWSLLRRTITTIVNKISLTTTFTTFIRLHHDLCTSRHLRRLRPHHTISQCSNPPLRSTWAHQGTSR